MNRFSLCMLLAAATLGACSEKPASTTAQTPAPVTTAAAASTAAVAKATTPGNQASAPPIAYDDSRGLIVAMGDSITSGAGSSTPAKTYLGQLSAATQTRTANLGGYGLTSAVVRAVPLIPEQATTVILDVGTNDVTAAASHTNPAGAAKQAKLFERDFDRLVEGVRRRVPRAQIVLVTVRDLGRSGVHSDQLDVHEPSLTAAVREWDDHERRYAAAHGITAVVDTETDPQWYAKSEYLPNALHPNDAGAARLAAALAPLIKRP